MTDPTPSPLPACASAALPAPEVAVCMDVPAHRQLPDLHTASVTAPSAAAHAASQSDVTLASTRASVQPGTSAIVSAAPEPASGNRSTPPIETASAPAVVVPEIPVRGEATAPVMPAGPGLELVVRTGADGSFSLWSEAFGEGFHSGRGALREARETFLNPSELQRFQPGSRIRVLEVCVGTGCNLAALLEACSSRQLRLDWTGLELDPQPLRLALSQPAFRAPWQPGTLRVLEHLQRRGEWQDGAEGSASRARMLWGDARQTLQRLQQHQAGRFDLIWHDAFSPQRCPQLWSLEFLGDQTRLLRSEGRWISYSSAAAVREALRLAGLQLAALQLQPYAVNHGQIWSGGTIASPSALPPSDLWRELSAMEQEHLACAAGEPYRDSSRTAPAAEMLAARQQAQAEALANGSRSSSSAWRRRWSVQG